MGKRHSRGQRASHDWTDPDSYYRESKRKRRQGKRRQLCAQVQRALSEALAADFGDDILGEPWVTRVEPTSGSGRLPVWLLVPADLAVERVLARIAEVSGVLRSEVAAAIARKRVPHLSFAIEGAANDME